MNTVVMKLSAEEAELIEAICNLQNAYPNEYPQLMWYAQEFFDQMVDLPKEDWKSPAPKGRTYYE